MSAKTSAQPGRRTPLSLSGAVTKSHPNKGSNNITNGGSINANGHPASNNSKQDNKLQQQKTDQPAVNNLEAKENPNKKQQTQAEKKSQPIESKNSNEKRQTGANGSNKQEANEHKQQQQQNKEKVQHQTLNDENKMNEKEKSDKSDKPKDKTEKDIPKPKEDRKIEHSMPQNKKDEKKTKEPRDTKEDKTDVNSKSDANTEPQQQIKANDSKSNDVDKKEKVKSVDTKSEEKVEKMATPEDQNMQKSSNCATPKSSSKANKTATPVKTTPTKNIEKITPKATATNRVKTAPTYKREVTTTIDDKDVEMEPLAMESSPVKSSQADEAANIKIVPSATSTPGKSLLPKRSSGLPKSDVAMQMQCSPERPRMFSQISGRKSIRPISDYTPSKFQSNLQFRESYRRINTELDVTNTSMNVTVGSEAPSNFSFSFFGRGRKRDRGSSPQHSQSAIGELQTDIEISPPKKARLDIHGLLSAVSSPISLLRNRFSKASLQCSTPVKLQLKLNADEDEIEVQNVSGVSVHEEITTPDKEPADTNLKIDGNDTTLGEEAKETKMKENTPFEFHSQGKDNKEGESFDQSDIKIKETPLQTAVGDEIAKNKRCAVM